MLDLVEHMALVGALNWTLSDASDAAFFSLHKLGYVISGFGFDLDL